MHNLIEKIRKGDPITDQELAKGIWHYSTLTDLLREHGDLYHLTWRHAHEELVRLESMRDMRSRK